MGRYPAGTDGTWHHVGRVVDRTDEQIRLYIDGEETASKSTQGWVETVDVTDFVLGADGVKSAALRTLMWMSCTYTRKLWRKRMCRS